MKSKTPFWSAPNTGATNESGFSALPGGRPGAWSEGFGYLWSSTASDQDNAWRLTLSYDNCALLEQYVSKMHGHAVRLVRDLPADPVPGQASAAYIVDNGISKPRMFHENFSISYSAIHDDFIGKMANADNFELTKDIKPGFIAAAVPLSDGLDLSMASPLRKSALEKGLKEYSFADMFPYYRPAFSDAANRTRINRNIDDVGAYEKHIRIMCIGDDNTVGYDDGNFRWNFRKKLKELLEVKNYEIDFTGSIPDVTCDGGHEGVAGKTIDYFSGIVAGKVLDHKPNLILFLGGSTDIANGTSPATVFERLYKAGTPSFVYNLTKSPSVLNEDLKLLISCIPPVTTQEDNFVEFNDDINSYGWSSVNANILAVNPITTAIYNPDGVGGFKYPLSRDIKSLMQGGYDILADFYCNAIDNLFKP